MDIIELAEDRPALKGWLEAAKGNECLYQFVHRRYWSSLEIDHADLVTSPWELRVYERRASRSKRDNYEYDGRLRFNEFSSEDEQGESSAERQDRLKKEWWNEMYGQKQYRDREIERSGRIYDAVRPDPLARGIIPARLVRDLTFGLTFDAFLLRHQSNPSFLQASVPTGETLEHSLTQLFPWFVNVQSVTVRGVVTQELLNRIASLPRRNVKFLKLRVQSCLAYFRTAGLRGLCNAYFIDWTALKQFTSLHTLQINNLRHDEGSSLAVAVGGLTSLEKLHVESIYAIGQLQSSPLTAFFSGLFSNSWSNTGRAVRDGSRIPRTLKSLHINDKYYME